MAIRSRNKRSGWTPVPNFRLEDDSIDPYDLRVAIWLFSHADTYTGKTNRSAISKAVKMSPNRTGTSLRNLRDLGIIFFEDGGEGWGGARSELEIEVDHEAWSTEPIKRVALESKRVALDPDDSHLSTGEDQVRTPPQAPPTGGGEIAPADDADDEFEHLWERFPRTRGDKASARRNWSKLSDSQKAAALEALPKWLAYWEAKNEPEYIPACSSWIGTKRTKHGFEGFIPPLPKSATSKSNPFIDMMRGDEQ